MYDFRLTEEQEALRTMVREFVERVVKPKAAVYDAEPDPVKGIPWDIIEAGHELGLNSLCVREDLGGGGADSMTLGMLVEELARGDLGVSVIYAQNWIRNQQAYLALDAVDVLLPEFYQRDDHRCPGKAGPE